MTSSSTKSPNKRRLELIYLFWQTQIMQAFREGKGKFFRTPDTTKSTSKRQFLSICFAEPDNVPFPEDFVEYRFDTVRCADVLFGYVVAEGYLIVPPFEMTPGRVDDIPLFEAEKTPCSRSR